jgi:hypothetical protein
LVPRTTAAAAVLAKSSHWPLGSSGRNNLLGFL